jgi:hypothetical protein
MKKIFLILCLFTLFSQIKADINPLSKYISSEDYKIGEEKFNESKNIFEEKGFDRSAILKEITDAENRIKSVFTRVLATVDKDNKPSAVIYYTNPAISKSQRIVISGKTAIRVDGYNYYLIPYTGGVGVRDIRTGNYYKLEIKGR